MHHITISTVDPHPRRARIPLAAASKGRSSLAGAVRALAAALLCGTLLTGCSKEPAESGPSRPSGNGPVVMSFAVPGTWESAPRSAASVPRYTTSTPRIPTLPGQSGALPAPGAGAAANTPLDAANASYNPAVTPQSRAAAEKTFVPLGENVTVRIVAFKAGEQKNPATENFVAQQVYAVSGGSLTPGTVDADGKFTASDALRMELLPGRYDFYAITPALPLHDDLTTVDVPNGVDYAVSATLGVTVETDDYTKAFSLKLKELDRKCVRIILKVKPTDRSDFITGLSLTPDGGGARFSGISDTVRNACIDGADNLQAPVDGSYTIPSAAFTATDATTVAASAVLLPLTSDRMKLECDLDYTLSGDAAPRQTTLSADVPLTLTQGQSCLLTLSVQQAQGSAYLSVTDWTVSELRLDELGQMTEAYPYVLEGKYVVSADLWGPSTGSFHDNWTGDNIPSHTVDDPDKNTVSRKFEVARSYVAGVFNAQDAKAKCASYLENGSGWRLPTFAEQRVMLFKVRADLTAVAAIKTGWHSSCTMTAAKDGIWCITGYNEGGTGTRTFAEENFVRCVRDWGARSPYVKDGKYIVFRDQDGAYDDKIHPNWAAADMPAHTETDDANSVPRQLEIAQSNASAGMNWENAKAYCQYLYQDGSGWRLPTLRELDWIYRRNGALSVTKVGGFIWSGTNVASSGDTKAWSLNFDSDNGAHNQAEKTTGGAVRCVRDLGMLSYSYVLEGKYIVSGDEKGPAGGKFHNAWRDWEIPAIVDGSANDIPSKKFEVAKQDLPTNLDHLTSMMTCAAYSQGDGNGWRMPTKAEMQLIYDTRRVLNNVGALKSSAWYWTCTDTDASGAKAVQFSSYSGKLSADDKTAKATNYTTRCVRDVGVNRYPYVTGGNTIVTKDNNGNYGGGRHNNWRAIDVPSHNTSSGYNAVSDKFEVAKNASSENLTWFQAREFCRFYSEGAEGTMPDAVAGGGGGWRLPTHAELQMICKMKYALTGVDEFNNWWHWSCTDNAASSYNSEVWTMTYRGWTASTDKSSIANKPWTRCVRDAGTRSMPYVINGKTIIFDDGVNATSEPKHEQWWSGKTVYLDASQGTTTGQVPQRMSVAAYDNSWDATWEVCRDNCTGFTDNGTTTTNFWRLPNQHELRYVLQLSSCGALYNTTRLNSVSDYHCMHVRDPDPRNGDREFRLSWIGYDEMGWSNVSIYGPSKPAAWTSARGRCTKDW